MTRSEPADPTILHQSHLRGAAFTSSFAEEAAAIQLALEWATANHPEYSHTICTDSQSLLKAIERRSLVTHYLRSLLNARPGSTSLLWIPGLKGIPSKELSDSAAKAAALTTNDPPRPISYASARSLIRRTLTNPPPTNSRTAEVYSGLSWSKDCMATSNRSDAGLLARLRAGHTPLLKAYANLLDPSADPLCPLCKEEPQTIEHCLRRCPRLDATRHNICGSPSPPLKVLTTDHESLLALARVTLV